MPAEEAARIVRSLTKRMLREAVPEMPRPKQKTADDFGDILAAFSRPAAQEQHAASAPGPAQRMGIEPDEDAPRNAHPIRRLFKSLPFPWPNVDLTGGFSSRPGTAYGEEPVSGQEETARPGGPPGSREDPKPNEEAPRGKSRLSSFFESISLPWQAGIRGFAASLGRNPPETLPRGAADGKPTAAEDPQAGSDTRDAKIAPPQRAKTEDEAIAEELGLSPELGLVDLKRIRRDFAKKNHPDRFEPARRRSAERRMSIANMLIDEQMRHSRQLR
jgi:hypothetical protein